MINEIRLLGGSCLVKHRIGKYFKYGFSLVFPPTDRDWKAEDHGNKYNYKDSKYDGLDENKGPMTFKIRKIYDNMIIVSHNSNIEKMLERNEQLETNAKEDGKGLYISSLFCSFVSFLRYIDINGIDYSFPQLKKIEFPDELPKQHQDDKIDASTNISNTDVKTHNDLKRLLLKIHGSKTTKPQLENISNKSVNVNTIKDKTINNIQIDDITSDDISIKSNGNVSFKNKELNVKFLDRFGTLYKNNEWYAKFYKSMLLTDYNNDD